MAIEIGKPAPERVKQNDATAELLEGERLRKARLDPGRVHLLHFVGRVPIFCEKRPQGEGHRKNERKEIAKRHDIGRGGAVGRVLFRSVVTQADLVLVVEPALVVFSAGGGEDPLTKAPAHGAEVITERLTVGFACEGGEEMGLASDEAVPNVEDGLDLVVDDVVREAQVLHVFFAEEDARLHLFEIGEREG
jgi:hypothetical protein